MPYGVGAAGGAVSVKPGYDASAISTALLVNALPTGLSDGSRTVQRRRMLAPSSVVASSGGATTGDHATILGSGSSTNCSLTQAAFASTSRPVSTNSTWLRKPPSSLT